MKTLTLIALLQSSALLAQNDLTLEGARWEARFTSFRCGAFTEAVTLPTDFQRFAVAFSTIVTDRSLDNGLLKATFQENETLCNYSALLLADNAEATIKLVDSKAYAPENSSESCSEGKIMLDSYFADNRYLYWGHPHHLTIMIPHSEAAVQCGGNSQHIGIDFQVSGRIN